MEENSYAKPVAWYTTNLAINSKVSLEGLGLLEDVETNNSMVSAALAIGKVDYRTALSLAQKDSLLDQFIASATKLDATRAPDAWFRQAAQTLFTKAKRTASRRKPVKSNPKSEPKSEIRSEDELSKPRNVSIPLSQNRHKDTPQPRQIQQHNAQRSRLASPAVPANPNLLLRFLPPGEDSYELISSATLYKRDARVASLDQLVREIENCEDGSGGHPVQIALEYHTGDFCKIRNDHVLDMFLRERAGEGATIITMRVTTNNMQGLENQQAVQAKSSSTARSAPNSDQSKRAHSPKATMPESKRLKSTHNVNGPNDPKADPNAKPPGVVDPDTEKYRAPLSHLPRPDSPAPPSPPSRPDSPAPPSPYEPPNKDEPTKVTKNASKVSPKQPIQLVAKDKFEDEPTEATKDASKEKDVSTKQPIQPVVEDKLEDDPKLDYEEEKSESGSEPEEDVSDEEDHKQSNKDKFTSTLYDQAVQDSDMARVTEALLLLTLAYFPLLAKTQLLSSDLVKPPNFGLASGFKFSPFQIFGAVWCFHRERGGICPGGICADEAGSGKTIVMELLYLLSYFHYQNVRFVEIFWKAQESQKQFRTGTKPETEPHLLITAPPGSKCPSACRQPIACYCEPDNRNNLYRTRLYPGIRLNLTPAAGLRSFQQDAIKMFDGGKIMSRTNPPRIAIEYPEYCKHHLFGGLNFEERSSFAKKPDWSNDKNFEASHRRQIVNGRLDDGYWFEKSLDGPMATDPTATESHAGRDSSSVLIVTTPGCYQSRVKNKFTVTRTVDWYHLARTSRSTFLASKHYSVLQIAAIAWDECQLALQGTTVAEIVKTASDDFRRVNHIPVSFACFSGTPDQGNPILPLVILVKTLRVPAWNTISPTHPELAGLNKLTLEKVQENKKIFERLCEKAKFGASKPTQDPKYKPLLEFMHKTVPSFQIRRTHKTRWFDGTPLIPKVCRLIAIRRESKPGHVESQLVHAMEDRVTSETDRRFAEAMEEWNNDPWHKEREKPTKPSIKGSSDYNIARVTATLATITDFWERSMEAEDEKQRFNIENKLIAKWIRFEEDFKPTLEQNAVQDLCKIQDVLKVCRWAKEKKRTDGSRFKVLIGSRLPLVRAAIMGVLKLKYSQTTDKILRYDNNMSQKARDNTLSAFDLDEKVFAMVASLKAAGVALNAQRATIAIMMEPSHKIGELIQYFARVDRRGQTEPIVWGIVLSNQASNIEQRMGESIGFHQKLQSSMTNDVDNDDYLEGDKVVVDRPDLDPFSTGLDSCSDVDQSLV